MTKVRDTKDDVAIEDGRPTMMGPEVNEHIEQIFQDPKSEMVIMVAVLDNEFAVKCFGAPSLKLAELLDQVARDYRRAVELSAQGPVQ